MPDFNLSTSMKDGKLYFNLSGRIASQNSTELSNLLTSERKNHPKGSVIFDCEDLEYISSAGLRVLLSFHKKEAQTMKIINVSPEAYEIFDITGFTEIFDVTKKLRDVSNKEVHMMGVSGGVTVYYAGDDRLLKVYPEGTSLDTIEMERQYSQAAMIFEIPTLIAYDIVTYKGLYGMLYELSNVKTVYSMIAASKSRQNQYSDAMGKLLRQIHSVEPMIDKIPRISDVYKKYAENMSKWLRSAEVDALIKLIDIIPEADTLLYGNYNARNVFVQQSGELILINMMGIRLGNPIYDLGKIYMTYKNNSDKMIKRLSGFEILQAQRFWEMMMCGYFDTNNLAEITKHEKAMKAASYLCSALYPASYQASNGFSMSLDDIEFFVSTARRDLFPSINEIAKLLSSREFIKEN